MRTLVVNMGSLVALPALLLLGVVAVGGCANVSAQQEQARAVEQELLQALQNYKIHTRAYPESLDELVENSRSQRMWKGPYIDRLPDDPWGRSYHYENDRGRVILTSYGRDGKPGGKGADQDIETAFPPRR